MKNKMPTIFTNMSENEIYTHLASGKVTISHSGYDRCCVYKSSNQDILEVYTDIAFDLNRYDQNGNMHNVKTGKGKVLIPSTGLYFVNYHIKAVGEPSIIYHSRILVNNSFEILETSGDSRPGQEGKVHLHQSDMLLFSKGDILRLQDRQNDGKQGKILCDSTVFSVVRIF